MNYMRLLYILINFLFVLKYSIRVGIISTYAMDKSYLFPVVTAGCCVVYLIFSSLLIFNIHKLPKINRKKSMVLMTLGLVILTVAQLSINPGILMVDRWSAIHNFIACLFNGEYPYGAVTHLGGHGSPFPVWQFFHIPFYLLGDVALSFIPVTVFLLWTIFKLYGQQTTFRIFLLLVFSPAFVYEVIVRSDLITNFLLVMAIINCFIYYKVTLKTHPWLVAVIAGLLMSTRLSVATVLIIYFLAEYIQLKWSQKVMVPLVSILVFVLTFLPLFFWDVTFFSVSTKNPFILQSRQGNFTDILWIVPLLMVCALQYKKKIDYYRNTAIFLFLFVSLIFIHNMWNKNNFDSLFTSFYDITYFDMALPFCLIPLVCRDGRLSDC